MEPLKYFYFISFTFLCHGHISEITTLHNAKKYQVDILQKDGAILEESIDEKGKFPWKYESGLGRSRSKRQIFLPLNFTVESIFPEYGQRSGNVVFVHGMNFDLITSEDNVTLGRTPCLCPETLHDLIINGTGCRNQTLFVCVYKDAQDTVNEVRFRISYSGNLFIGLPTYTFHEDPILDHISPLRTPIFGGTRVTLNGRHFMNVRTMVIILSALWQGQPYGAPQHSDPCTIVNDTQAVCVTRCEVPGIIDPDLRRRKRAVGLTSCLNNQLFTMNVSVRFDDIQVNVTQLNSSNEMCITGNPLIDDFKDQIYELKLYKGDLKLLISGRRLNFGIQVEDYKVYVGNTSCNITRIVSNLLTCIPPSTVPDDLGLLQKDGLPLVRVLAGTNLEYAPGYLKYQFTPPADMINLPAVLGGLLAALLILILAIGLYCCWRRPRKQDPPIVERGDHVYTSLCTAEEASFLDLLDEDLQALVKDCRLKSHDLEQTREIGSGQFGKVFIGKLSFKNDERRREKRVAVKTIKDEGVTLNQLKEFLKEATLMKDLKHENVLNLIGVIIEGNKPYVILPFMENGDLKSFVSNSKNKFKVIDLIQLCIQVADGMTFLAEQKIIHRDLRAVNCLVDKRVVVKVADFGLSRDIYNDDYYTVQDHQRPLPLKWMSPEALEGFPVSSAADVWSYGVLMWEVFTRGKRPYADIPNGYHELKEHLQRGRRLERPQFCTHDVYAIMMTCWERDPHKRKSFKDLANLQRDLLQANTAGTSIPQTQDQAADDKHISEIYFEPRISTNEYLKDPKVVNEYLVVIGDDSTIQKQDGVDGHGYMVPRPSSKQQANQHEMLVPSMEEALRGSDQAVAGSSQALVSESSPYFVNPPISAEYLSMEGQEKVKVSSHPPRGLLYDPANSAEEKDGEYENYTERESKYENMFDTENKEEKNRETGEEEEEGRLGGHIEGEREEKGRGSEGEGGVGLLYENQREEGKKGKRMENENELPYVNVIEKAVGHVKDEQLEDAALSVEVPTSPSVKEAETDYDLTSATGPGKDYVNEQAAKTAAISENVVLDVHSLVSKFGGALKTSDYSNQPAHNRREKKIVPQ